MRAVFHIHLCFSQTFSLKIASTLSFLSICNSGADQVRPALLQKMRRDEYPSGARSRDLYDTSCQFFIDAKQHLKKWA